MQVGEQSNKTWSLELVKADEGVLEDATLRMDAKLVPVVSLTPEEVFTVK